MKKEWKRTNDAASADSSQEDSKLKPFHIWIWMGFFFFRERMEFNPPCWREQKDDKGGGGF